MRWNLNLGSRRLDLRITSDADRFEKTPLYSFAGTFSKCGDSRVTREALGEVANYAAGLIISPSGGFFRAATSNESGEADIKRELT
jgi:hypothetical protein